MSSLGVARDKEGIVDSAPDGTELPSAHLPFLALILAHAAPVVFGKFLQKKLDIFTKIITLISALTKQAILFPGSI